MFNDFSQIFVSSLLPIQRNYDMRSPLRNTPNLVQKVKFKYLKRDQLIFDGILDFLLNPIEYWGLQYQGIFQYYALDQWIYTEILKSQENFPKIKHAKDKESQQIRQIISQLRLQHKLQIPTIQKPKISLHNIFVLITQYKLMQKIIQDITPSEFQMIINGVSLIYLQGYRNIQNFGNDLTEQEILMDRQRWGTIDQLTCCIHYILTHAHFNKYHRSRGSQIFYKLVNVQNLPFFIQVYNTLENDSKIDNVINSIPMFIQFLEYFSQCTKHKNQANYQLINQIKWLSGVSIKIIELIQFNINKLLIQNNQFQEQLTIQQLQLISTLGQLNQGSQKQQSLLQRKLRQKARLLMQTQGFINCRILFSEAFKNLYTVYLLIKLTKIILQIAKDDQSTYNNISENAYRFLLKLFQCIHKYQYDLPETSIVQVCNVIKILFENQSSIDRQRQFQSVTHLNQLYLNHLQNPKLKGFVYKLQHSKRFGYYHNRIFNKNFSNKLNSNNEQLTQDCKVSLQLNEDSFFFYVLGCIYNMKIQLLPIIYTALKYINKHHFLMFQFFLIKNQLLHFLVQSGHQIVEKDKKLLKSLYSTIALLIKGNMVAYAIFNDVLIIETQKVSEINYFIEDIKNHFSQAKQLILISFADSISYNILCDNKDLFQCQIINKMIKPSTAQLLKNDKSKSKHQTQLLKIDKSKSKHQTQLLKNDKSKSKHQIWISYILNVVLTQMHTLKRKIQQQNRKKHKIDIPGYVDLTKNHSTIYTIKQKHPIQKQINQWITLIIFIHIDYVQTNKQGNQDEFLISQLVMIYLSTILTDSIRQKHKNSQSQIINYLRMLKDWQNYYTDMILAQQKNQDILQKQFGKQIKFLHLKRWTKKIIKSITMYLDSMQDYDHQMRQNSKPLQKVKSQSYFN